MKAAVKLVVLLLLLTLVMALAACGANEEPSEPVAEEPEIEAIVTPTDLEEEFVPDPADTAENETYLSDYAEASTRLGVQLAFPADFDIYRVLLVDEDKVQVEFYYNDVFYLGQYVVGMQEDLSGLGGGFSRNETATIAELSVRLGYTPAVKNAEGQTTTAQGKLALAETYDQGNNITAWLVDNDFVEIAAFKPVVEMFLLSLTDAYVEQQPTQEAAQPAA